MAKKKKKKEKRIIAYTFDMSLLNTYVLSLENIALVLVVLKVEQQRDT